MKIKYWFNDFNDLKELDLVTLEDLIKKLHQRVLILQDGMMNILHLIPTK